MTNKYSEGYPGARYYGGNEYVDLVMNVFVSDSKIYRIFCVLILELRVWFGV